MELGGKRASGRVELELPIEILGTDCLGIQFFDRARALVVGRHGAKICLERMLAPQQELTVRCPATDVEADACVVGQLGKSGDVYCYGIKFLDEKASIWGIEFPPLTEADESIGRVMLKCIGCESQEAVYLDEFEREVLEANDRIYHPCKRCRDVSLWQKSRDQTPELALVPAAPANPAELQDRRREPRRQMTLTACVRTARFGEDLVKTRTVSRSGLSFTSPWDYVPGQALEVAVPYSPQGGNLFLPAKIVRVEFLGAEATRIYGILYQNIK